ncbi:transporter [Vibrio sp. 10N.286.49.B3]|uniref:MFS transporter n=1 Tax=Vibrio sp. 10N.286.49.B3 TaxID=1880855 RepID=UPI000C85AC31|nr:MFS transporter [Vibrio sp. 10N.286.49.B3]PMH43232.1 transporter [Vibrio sp. 10N.286.49.B3]
MSRSLRINIIVFLGILFLALNLRAPFTSLAPVLTQIMDYFDLNASAAGFLTALPLITFAIFSPIVSKISQRIGLEPSLVVALLMITTGIVLRSSGLLPALYIGTILIGIGIAIGNVLLPVVVKLTFPARIATVTSLYIFTMGAGSTFSSSLMVPFSELTIFTLSGWQLALLINLLLPILALSIWLPRITKRPSKVAVNRPEEKTVSMKALLKNSIAWQVTLALGLNSFTFYSFAGWLPKILNDLGYSEIDAGYIYGFLQFSTMIPGLLLLPILARTNNQQRLVAICASGVFIGLVGLLLLPSYAIFWVGLFGLANCSTFIIVLSFIGLRTSNSGQAASLSGMSQGIGYALAATGPTLIGKMHTQTESWLIPILIIATIALACTVFATLAARDRKIEL